METQTLDQSESHSKRDVLLQLEKVTKHFPVKKGFFNKQVGAIQALNNVTLDVYKGETLGVVGESGCGKSTLARCILQLLRPTSGNVLFEGQELTKLSFNQLRPLRCDMQIIFQNPYASLDPRMSVGNSIAEPFIIHKLAKGPELTKKVQELLDLVGLPQSAYNRYPHELSGGQCQRVGVARALALKPKLIIADEAVSALDVSVQAQILNLLNDLKDEFNLTYIFISHNLGVVEYVSDRVAVMYLGEVVEMAPVASLYKTPLHPYTKALLSAIPHPDPNYDTSQRILLEGDLPSPGNPPSGCRFHTRCHFMMESCKEAAQEGEEYVKEHFVHCHRTKDINNL